MPPDSPFGQLGSCWGVALASGTRTGGSSLVVNARLTVGKLSIARWLVGLGDCLSEPLAPLTLRRRLALTDIHGAGHLQQVGVTSNPQRFRRALNRHRVSLDAVTFGWLGSIAPSFSIPPALLVLAWCVPTPSPYHTNLPRRIGPAFICATVCVLAHLSSLVQVCPCHPYVCRN